MAVPEEIRKVRRPVNTIVEDNHNSGSNKYSVRERTYVEYVKGGNPRPKNGKVIGHIINGVYVPLVDGVKKEEADMYSYGASAFIKSVSDDIFMDLLSVYSIPEATGIISLASLKVIKPGLSASRMRSEYERQYLSVYYPDAALSENTIGELYKKIGISGKRRADFYLKRLEEVKNAHHLIIDGMLKQDNSSVNDLSAFSRKARVRGTKDISLLYLYDLEKMEPVCAEVFPGNSIDASSYEAFISDNDIKKGILITDKGFPVNMIAKELKERPELHFLTPIRRNDVRIKDNDMFQWTGILKGIDKQVLFSKKQIKGGRFLYAFCDKNKANKEEYTYLKKIEGVKADPFSPSDYFSTKETFGTIVFESDQDLDPKVVYRSYADRWQLELVFDRYKNDECLDKTGVHGDFSVIGAEFVNFISTLITMRLLKKATDASMLDNSTFGELMDDLTSAWRKVNDSKEVVSDDEYWVHTRNYVKDELEALGLSVPTPKPEPQKRGRKKKEKPLLDKPKRPRGRPRKTPLS